MVTYATAPSESRKRRFLSYRRAAHAAETSKKPRSDDPGGARIRTAVVHHERLRPHLAGRHRRGDWALPARRDSPLQLEGGYRRGTHVPRHACTCRELPPRRIG